MKLNRKSLKNISEYRNLKSAYDKEGIPVSGEMIRCIVLGKLETHLYT